LFAWKQAAGNRSIPEPKDEWNREKRLRRWSIDIIEEGFWVASPELHEKPVLSKFVLEEHLRRKS
jgi:hypothetical protein